MTPEETIEQLSRELDEARAALAATRHAPGPTTTTTPGKASLCQHGDFDSRTNVHRQITPEGHVWTIEVWAWCKECGHNFGFPCKEHGSHPSIKLPIIP